ncbi:MAG: response regulator transcription factor [Candidatus Gracilibacteria bacterium]|nr:response regulator transcription factor [Candidatus Gracilibacteria bacterium]
MYITIIEDEKILSANIAKKLNKSGFNTCIINSYQEFVNANQDKPDLYIIDISLIDGSGFDIIKYIRKERKLKTPIIITSGFDNTEKKIYGLDLGADDYLQKPYSIEELIARIRALLRRSFGSHVGSEINYNNISYNLSEKLIRKNGTIIELTGRELQFVEYMLFNIGKIITKSEIINSVWGSYDELSVSDNTINVTTSKVRKKLGDNFKLKTLINRGYLLEE